MSCYASEGDVPGLADDCPLMLVLASAELRRGTCVISSTNCCWTADTPPEEKQLQKKGKALCLPNTCVDKFSS